jgi:hypothetical protein
MYRILRREATTLKPITHGKATLPLKPDRIEALEECASRHGQAPAHALDEVVATHLASERQDFEEAAEDIRRGMEDVLAGRTRPARKFLDELGAKHGLSR